jgi:hypothetical protein
MNTLLAPSTGRPCGGESVCSVPADACSPGWHICGIGAYGPKDLSDRISSDQCRDAVDGEMVAALGDQSCDCYRGGAGAICCGKKCIQQGGSCVWPNSTAWFGMVDGHVQSCGDIEMKWGGAYGVMCCKD